MDVRLATAVVGLLIATAALAGCGDHAGHGKPAVRSATLSAAPAPPRAVATRQARLRCEMPVWSGRHPPHGTGSAIGIMALDLAVPRSGTYSATQAPHHLMAKTWLFIRTHRTATLSLTGPWSTRVALQWGTAAQLAPWTTSLVIPPCPDEGEGKWIAFPGAFAFDQPACVPLRLIADATSTTLHVSVGGKACKA